MINEKVFLVSLIITFGLTVILTKKLIPLLLSKKIGQKILDIGPRWHKNKEGTPTMGGIGFIIAIVVAFVTVCAIFGRKIEKTELLTIINIFLFAILNCFIGLIDDIAKLKKEKNQGLTPKGKLLLQSVAAIVFLVLMRATTSLSTVLKIPFTSVELDIGFFYYVFAFLLLCGVTNAVNLTDGIDGLASTCILSVGVFLTFVGIVALENTAVSFFAAILIGAALGFLVFNFHPAKVFMGDTGSLFFGAIAVSTSFAFNNPLLVFLYGFVFIFEAISVILQVIYFKLTKGKRLFKMAPFHHHLEKCGLSEIKVVSILGIVNSIFCIIAYFGI